jgi:hypothetical protein
MRVRPAAGCEGEGCPGTDLAHSLSHPGEVISKNELLETVWPGVFVTENTLEPGVAMAPNTSEGHFASTMLGSLAGGAVFMGTQGMPWTQSPPSSRLLV